MLNLPPVSIPATHARIVHSAIANDDYLISVALPIVRRGMVWLSSELSASRSRF